MMQSFKFPGTFKKVSHKKFNYEPIYYDSQKEERQQRNKDIEAELNGARPASYISREFRQNLSREHGQSNRRVIYILAALLLTAYYFMMN